VTLSPITAAHSLARQASEQASYSSKSPTPSGRQGVSGGGDQGADPNALVTITDSISATSLPTDESFTTLVSAGFAEVLRGYRSLRDWAGWVE
jgi:hypothetical protein